MREVYSDAAATVLCGDALDPGSVRECDAVVVDAPYSAKTHGGHDAFREYKGNPKGWKRGDGGSDPAVHRRRLDYGCWTAGDVARAVALWSPGCRGWFVSITDDLLAPVWSAELERAGRYVFAPLPFVAPGSRVRLTGDGPSGWTTWIVVARPRTPEFVRWGTLPGAYVLPPGCAERMPVVGGKPEWLCERLVEDYTRPGNLIVDFCAGGGTLGVAAKRLGRRALLVERMEEHCAIAASRVSKAHAQETLTFGEGPVEQVPLEGLG